MSFQMRIKVSASREAKECRDKLNCHQVQRICPNISWPIKLPRCSVNISIDCKFRGLTQIQFGWIRWITDEKTDHPAQNEKMNLLAVYTRLLWWSQVLRTSIYLWDRHWTPHWKWSWCLAWRWREVHGRLWRWLLALTDVRDSKASH